MAGVIFALHLQWVHSTSVRQSFNVSCPAFAHFSKDSPFCQGKGLGVASGCARSPTRVELHLTYASLFVLNPSYKNSLFPTPCRSARSAPPEPAHPSKDVYYFSGRIVIAPDKPPSRCLHVHVWLHINCVTLLQAYFNLAILHHG